MTNIALQTRNLSKHFGALTAVDDLSLDVRVGEIFGFLGPNGAGKTTSILMMCGLMRPDAGDVLIDGVPSCAATRPSAPGWESVPRKISSGKS